MRFATLALDEGTRAAIDLEDHWRLLPYQDLAEALRAVDGDVVALGDLLEPDSIAKEEARLANPLRTPSKILCLGQNFADHVREMSHESIPKYPTLFAKYPLTLTDPYADIVHPRETTQMDWEVEIGVVIGRPARHVAAADALDHVAGYVVVNDVSMRDYQYRTSQFLQGKIFERTTPVGPWMVTRDEVDDARDLRMQLLVDGELRQDGRSSDMLIGIPETIAYASAILTLEPGDLISMGTPSGVGFGRDPKVFLAPGQVMESVVEGIGALRNRIVAPPTSS
jgi:acylpyruvate hydrolase